MEYVLLHDYKIDRDSIEYKISDYDVEFYTNWKDKINWVINNGVHTTNKIDMIFVFKTDKWYGFQLTNATLKEFNDESHDVKILYDNYRTLSDEFLNKLLKYELRIEKIKDFL
jgi:hypothetical protein